MPIQNWIVYSMDYFKTCHIPIYLIPDDDFLLLKLDYIGLYFPKIYFYKFGYIKAILSSTHLSTDTFFHNYEISISSSNISKIVDMVDLTKDFMEYAQVEKINYNEFASMMFYLLKGDTSFIKQYKKEYQPLLPFFNFMNLDSDYLDIIR
jgi:hypothetical protein